MRRLSKVQPGAGRIAARSRLARSQLVSRAGAPPAPRRPRLRPSASAPATRPPHRGAGGGVRFGRGGPPGSVSHRTCLRLGDLCHSERGQPGPQRHGSRVASVTPLSSAPRGPRLPPTAGASVQPACLAPGPNQDPFQNSSRQPDWCARNPASERARVRRLDFICTEDSQETTWYSSY